MSELPASEVISVDRSEGIATIWLDRAEKRNACGPRFWTDLPRIVEALGDDAGTRVIVIAARGPAFTVGLDLHAFGQTLVTGGLDPSAVPTSEVAKRRQTYQLVKTMQHTFTALAEAPQPVIAAVHGYCIGAGVDLITACDIRLAAADSVFSVRETKLAMVADVGTLQRLPQIVEPGRVAELVYTGRDFDADEALAIGLVSRVLPDAAATLAAALSIAGDIAANSPLAVQGAKRVLRNKGEMTIDQQLDYVALWNAAFLHSEDLGEAIASFLERRPPRYRGH